MENFCKKYLKISFWLLTIINLILFFIFLIVLLCNKNYSFFYGFLLCFLLPYIILFFIFIKWKIFSLKGSKKTIIISLVLSKILAILFFVFLPIIGVQNNISHHNIIFNLWGMLPPTIISFIYLFLNQIFLPFFLRDKYNSIDKKR